MHQLWSLREREVAEYLKALKKEIEGSEAERHVADYLDIILEGLEPNPREIKRFINNFILVSRISRKETDPGKLLAVLVTQFRWEDLPLPTAQPGQRPPTTELHRERRRHLYPGHPRLHR